MHLDEGQVLEFAHGELDPQVSASLHAHLGLCAECRERVERAEREEEELHALLRHLDHPVPWVDAAALAPGALPGLPHWARWAAAVTLLLCATGIAYAAPGSPLPGWIATAVKSFGEGREALSRPAPAPAELRSGVAVVPEGDFVVQFETFRPEGRATLLLTEGREVEVSSLGGAPIFTSEADRVVVGAGPPAVFEIRVPRDVPRVEVRVGERRVFLKEGSSVSTDAAPDAAGRYLLRLDDPGG